MAMEFAAAAAEIDDALELDAAAAAGIDDALELADESPLRSSGNLRDPAADADAD